MHKIVKLSQLYKNISWNVCFIYSIILQAINKAQHMHSVLLSVPLEKSCAFICNETGRDKTDISR